MYDVWFLNEKAEGERVCVRCNRDILPSGRGEYEMGERPLHMQLSIRIHVRKKMYMAIVS